MNQWKIIKNRLTKPSVLLSICSQLISLLILLGVNVDSQLVMAIATSISTILVTAGILSNPDTKVMHYGDDMATCTNCNTKTHHVVINDNLVCKNCGCSTNTK